MKRLFKCLLAASLLFYSSILAAQQINLDAPVKAGDLTLFPEIGNPNVYYFLSDKPHLAKDENGKPKFSFLRYVSNTISAADQAASREGDGGGILHAVVSLAVTPDQLSEANRELQRVKPGANIQGPVIYKSGRFSIVSSFKDPQGGLSTQVVGMGSAPVMDGHQAAISIQLTKQGAKVLWESFQTTAPDISFTFEMEIAGYRAPKRAVIEANFDQIYEHKSFNAGVATQFLAAEIRTSFDDLVRSGAIKLTQVGEDEKMEALITTAYNKIADIMFSPLNGSGTPSLSDLTSSTGQSTSLLDRATQMLHQGRQEARDVNRENEARQANQRVPTTPPVSTTTGTTGTSRGTTGSTASTPPASPSTPASDEPPTASARASGITPAGTTAPGVPPPASNTPSAPQNEAVPSFSIVAAFEMKRIHQQGTFRIDLNKSTADKINVRFDENIGNLTSYQNDVSVFRQANLDDALYVQRELTAFVDGMNTQDFGQYINFVNLRMRKQHQGGAVTNEEIRIDRNNFNREGNNFKMVYGWKGDNDRRRWMDYEYESEWSFFGGQSVVVPMQRTTSSAINLVPPFQKRTVEVQADPAILSGRGVRLISVKIFYIVNGSEQTKMVTLNPSKNQLSEKVEFILPVNSYDYQYEINWQLGDNQTRSSGRLSSSSAVLSVDSITNP